MTLIGYFHLLDLNEILNRTLDEALRIISKGSDVSDDSVIIGKFQGKEVIKTTHTGELRDKEARDSGLSNQELIALLKKIPTSVKLSNDKYYNISYKNQDDNYDMFIIYVDARVIRFVTILQQSRKSDNYKIKPGDVKLVVEGLETIEL